MSIVVRSNEKPQTPPKTAEASHGREAEAAVTSQGRDDSASESQGNGEASGSEKTLSALDETSSEQKNASDSETEGDAVDTKKDEEAVDSKDEPKKKGGFQRRIDKLNAQKAQAQQELEYWKQMALKNAGTESKSTQTPAQTQSAPLTSQSKPTPEHFDTHAEYVEALADWKTEQKLRERDERASKERLNQEQSKIVHSYQERVKTFATKASDFQEVLADVDHIPLSPALRDIILNSDNGPELAYELAKTPGEFERIAKLPPLSCAREMGRFEARLSSSSKASPAQAEKKITQAPKPIEPVGTGGKGSVPKSIFDPNLSQKEYETLRRDQMKKRRQA